MNQSHWGDIVVECVSKHGPLVVGIDPVFDEIPEVFKTMRLDSIGQAQCFRDYIAFLLDTIAEHISFVKYQSAFFEALGTQGISVLADAIHNAHWRGLRIILDAKRGDISSTATAYAQAYLTPYGGGSCSDLEVDCMTINPFLGPNTLEPFIDCARKYGKGLFILAKTSNPDAGWIQDLPVNDQNVSDQIARKIAEWADECTGQSGLSAVGAVVGATFPEDGRRLRQFMPKSVFLAPGIGTQGGAARSVETLRTPDGGGILVPLSRSITKVDDKTIALSAYRGEIIRRICTFKDKLS